MRIFQVVNVRWFNATAWYGLTLAQLLRDAGHDVLTLTLAGTESHYKALDMGLETVSLPLNSTNPLTVAWMYNELGRMVQGLRPEIVNCHRGESFILWGLLKRRLGSFKLVRTRGDQRPPRNNLFNRWLHQRVADAVIVTNTAMATHFREALGVEPGKLWLIYGGVDTRTFRYDPAGRERVRAEFGFAPDETVIGLVGRFDEVKGQRETIKAVATLYHELGLKQVRLFLVGFETATSEAEVRSWIDEYGIGPITRISGPRHDVPACLSALDLGVVASKWSETIARAALEIMACGRPLIGTRVGVMPDLLSPQALVEPGDANGLALAMARCVLRPQVRRELAAEQRLMVSRLTREDFLRQTLNVYTGLAE